MTIDQAERATKLLKAIEGIKTLTEDVRVLRANHTAQTIHVRVESRADSLPEECQRILHLNDEEEELLLDVLLESREKELTELEQELEKL